MPVNSPNNGVNTAPAAPAEAPQNEPVNPPAESTSAQETPAEKNVPYSRFKEVNDKMRSYEIESLELKRKLAEKQSTNETQSDPADNEAVVRYAKRLSDNGLNGDAARIMAEVMKDVAQERVSKALSAREKAELAELTETEESSKKIAKVQEEFRKAHTDYAEYEEGMQKEWDGLDEEAKLALVQSPKSYELLYKSAKAAHLEKAKQDGIEEGRNEAYEGKSLKRAISSVPGTAANPNKKYTAEDIGNMSMADYAANKDKILKDLGLRK